VTVDPGVAAIVAALATGAVSLGGLVISLRSSRRQAERQTDIQAGMAREERESSAVMAREQRTFYEQQIAEILRFTREQIGAVTGRQLVLPQEALEQFKNWVHDLDDWLWARPWTNEGAAQRVDELNALVGPYIWRTTDPWERDSFFSLRTFIWAAPSKRDADDASLDSYAFDVSHLAYALLEQIEHELKDGTAYIPIPAAAPP
jgi:hypothetical protein